MCLDCDWVVLSFYFVMLRIGCFGSEFVYFLFSSKSLLKPMRFLVTLRNVRFTILTVKMLLRREWVAAAVATTRLISSVRSLVEIRLVGVWFVYLFFVGRGFLQLIIV